MKYYLVFTRLEAPLAEPLPGEIKAANIVNEGCDLCLFDVTGTKIKWCAKHNAMDREHLILIVRKIDVIENVTPAEVEVAAIAAAEATWAEELVAVPA